MNTMVGQPDQGSTGNSGVSVVAVHLEQGPAEV